MQQTITDRKDFGARGTNRPTLFFSGNSLF